MDRVGLMLSVSIPDAIRALELLHTFDSQQEEPTLRELGIAQILERPRRGLLRQRLIIRLGQNQQTIDRYFVRGTSTDLLPLAER